MLIEGVIAVMGGCCGYWVCCGKWLSKEVASDEVNSFLAFFAKIQKSCQGRPCRRPERHIDAPKPREVLEAGVAPGIME